MDLSVISFDDARYYGQTQSFAIVVIFRAKPAKCFEDFMSIFFAYSTAVVGDAVGRFSFVGFSGNSNVARPWCFFARRDEKVTVDLSVSSSLVIQVGL